MSSTELLRGMLLDPIEELPATFGALVDQAREAVMAYKARPPGDHRPVFVRCGLDIIRSDKTYCQGFFATDTHMFFSFSGLQEYERCTVRVPPASLLSVGFLDNRRRGGVDRALEHVLARPTEHVMQFRRMVSPKNAFLTMTSLEIVYRTELFSHEDRAFPETPGILALKPIQAYYRLSGLDRSPLSVRPHMTQMMATCESVPELGGEPALRVEATIAPPAGGAPGSAKFPAKRSVHWALPLSLIHI